MNSTPLTRSSSLFSGLPVRELLLRIGFTPKNNDDVITLGLIFKTDNTTQAARGDSHLTNSTSQDQQIRFPLADRVRRSLRRLAHSVEPILERNPSVRPVLVELLQDDFVSREFFEALGIPASIVENGTVDTTLLLPEELKLLNLLENAADHRAELLAMADERLYASDYRAAYQMLMRLPDDMKNPQVRQILGLCCNFFGRTEESEIHFRHVLNSADPLDRVKAAYVISMLYLRMHARENQSLPEAELLLSEAFETIEANPQIANHTFHKVFNRNGYALCIYRRGRVEEALMMLDWGIAELRTTSGPGAQRLHESVLIYNAIQCLRDMGRFEECEARCEELLEIDPLFPEYHMERARALLLQERFDEALTSLKRALTLDKEIPELFSLIGFAHLQKMNLEEAAESYRQAYRLDPKNEEHRLDMEYCLAEMKEPACAAF